MRDEFEERLRRALEARATEVTPDPGLWRRVEARIHRERSTFRLALSGVAIAAVAVLAAVTARPLVTRTQIELIEGGGTNRPATASPAAPTPAPAAVAPQPARLVTGARYCGSAGGVAAVLATSSGDLAAACAAGGTEPLTQGADIDAHPVLHGGVVVFDRRATPTGGAHLATLDLETGEISSLDSGAWPAVGPNGELAYIVDAYGDSQQPEIVVRQALHGPIRRRFAVFAAPGAGELSARHLAFDAAGTRVFWEVGSKGSKVWTSPLDQPEPIQVGSTTEGAILAAPTSREPGTLTAIDRCCALEGGEPITVANLVTQDQRGTIAEFADLTKLEDFDVRSADLFLAPAGQVILRDGRWEPTDRPAWLVGDGRRLFLIGADGQAALVSDDAASGAFNASAAPAGASSVRLVTVQVYLARDDVADCKTTFAVPRRVTAPAVLRGALAQLLAGPTEEEKAQGYGGLFSSATEGYLRDVRLDPDGVAYVDFRDLSQVIPNASSSCASTVLLSQLNATVTQFRNIKAVRYSINSDEAAFYEWLQRTPPS